MRALIRLSLTALASFGCLVCTPDTGGSTPARAPEGQVTYRATWLTEGVTVDAQGTWSVTNDLGQHITVTRGWLTDYSVELAECAEGEGLGAALERVFGSGVAHAGHDSVPNPIAVRSARVESLSPPRALELGVVDLTGLTYCHAHYLVARAPDDAADLPTEQEMVGASLHLEGTWQAGGEPVAFQVHTTLANGRIADLVAAEGAEVFRLDTSAVSAVEVVVERDLGHLFDGVDFETMSSRSVERALLTNLLGQARIITQVTPTTEAR